MIKHVVAFRPRADADPRAVEALLAELATFPDRYPCMRRWALGENISTRDQAMSHAFTVEFDDEQALRAYLESEYHLTFVEQRWRPLVTERVIVSIVAE